MRAIEPVEEPTDRCSGLVLIPKPDKFIRMCVEYAKLNTFIRRKINPMPFTQNVLGELRAKYSTIFITQWGQYEYLRPHVQMKNLLVNAVDILVYGSTIGEQDNPPKSVFDDGTCQSQQQQMCFWNYKTEVFETYNRQ